jgi:phosphoribosyl-ATP pyrophosphohydrolase/phosphoribosyl-AMP cyclohydrolase
LKINWEKSSLIPAIAQDIRTNEVLMLGFMNKEAYELSQKTKIAHYFSRSKGRIWKKGEISGHTQTIKEMLLDCDQDTILLKVEQNGVACHTGNKTCFFDDILNCRNLGLANKDNFTSHYGILDRLYHTLQNRKQENSENSYVANLLKKGENAYLKKVSEEAAEFCLAVKDNSEQEIIYEAADLVFHMLVALVDKNIHPDKIEQELARRFGISGIEEKNSRKK